MAELSERDFYKALGLGEQVQEPAAPADTDAFEGENTGEQVQELADPASGAARAAREDAPADAPAPPEMQEGTDPGTDRRPLTPEQRRENAARRRQAETQAAIDKALAEQKKEHDRLMADLFARAGLKNTVTGEAIKSKEEFDQWDAELRRSKLERELKGGKLTTEGLSTAIGDHPAIKKAQELIDREARAEEARIQAEVKARIDGEIAQIHELDASINTVEDLFKAPYGQQLRELVGKGYSLPDAHYLLNREKLDAARLEAAKQQMEAALRSKTHMAPAAGARGSGSVTVPKAELDMYRLFNPDASDAQIQEHYNRNLKK